MSAHLTYTLQLADNALILGHRISEWCGHGPILEQDIAITNISLDHIGQARSLYQHAAGLFNQLSVEEKEAYTSSEQIKELVKQGKELTEDDLPYFRDVWDYRNVLLVEQPNGNWADTIARSFFYDVFYYLYYELLQKSTDTQLASIAEKSLKEVAYHRRWSSEWVIRLGDGTEESHEKMQDAVNNIWAYTGELFNMSEAETTMLSEGISIDTAELKTNWTEYVRQILEEATLTIPEDEFMHKGGKQTRHSEYLGFILTELQYVQRAYPGMEW